MVSAPVVLAACLGVPSQIAHAVRLLDHRVSIARNGCEPARTPVFCPSCRAAVVQNTSDTECGQAKNVDGDADHDAADQGPWGVLFGLSGGLTCTGPHNVNSHCTDCRTSPFHLVRPGRWE